MNDKMIRAIRSVANIDAVLPLLDKIAHDINTIDIANKVVSFETILKEYKKDIEELYFKEQPDVKDKE